MRSCLFVPSRLSRQGSNLMGGGLRQRRHSISQIEKRNAAGNQSNQIKAGKSDLHILCGATSSLQGLQEPSQGWQQVGMAVGRYGSRQVWQQVGMVVGRYGNNPGFWRYFEPNRHIWFAFKTGLHSSQRLRYGYQTKQLRIAFTGIRAWLADFCLSCKEFWLSWQGFSQGLNCTLFSLPASRVTPSV